MKYFTIGDQLVITKDNFVNLQESPAVFYPLDSKTAVTVLEAGTIEALSVDELGHIATLLEKLGWLIEEGYEGSVHG